VNAIVPLQKHLEMCQKIRHYAWPMCMNAELTESYKHFNDVYPQVFATIETVGLQVDETFRMPEIVKDGFVYSQYNYHTMTGRPSNAYRGFNFAAMNKEDGTRSAFCSRFENGALVEMDFDSYHVRLIAKLIRYELPVSSIHDYLGQFYFDVTELTEEQRAESKQITFRLLYGGIDSEFLAIQFFRQVNTFIYDLWSKWKSKHYVETPVLKRRLTADALKNMTANKLFNYYLQATETEVSVQKLHQVQELIKDYETTMILYTYDSVLFDVPLSEAKNLLPQIKQALEQGNFPTKVKVGNIYDKIKTISL
jgi:DNA polymerase I-like protein with 3'-5' exonuclease and polymerase domains